MEKGIILNQMKRFLCFLLLIIVFPTFVPQCAYCENSSEPEPYEKEEFPQWALDLRRFEIVSLGSIPFAMIGVTIGYGALEVHRGNMDSIPNPLNPSSLDESEQLKILGLTVCTGLAIGLVDFTVNQIIRHNQKKKLERINAAKQVNVVPISENTEPEEVENDIHPLEENEEDAN